MYVYTRLSRNSFACFYIHARKIGCVAYLFRNFVFTRNFHKNFVSSIRYSTMLIYYFETEQEFASRARQQERSIIDRRFTFGADCRLHRGRLHLFPCLYNSPSYCISFLFLPSSAECMYIHSPRWSYFPRTIFPVVPIIMYSATYFKTRLRKISNY